jgi:glutaminyl-tRNA synthetase
MTTPIPNEPPAPSDFIRDVVAEDLKSGKHTQIHTRFPPEPNGYLHIGHAKAICLNFGIAREFGGLCNVRMDDTNPAKEETEYVDSILADTKWLIDGWATENLGLKPAGKTPEKHLNGDKLDFELSAIRNPQSEIRTSPFHASDYFEQFYEYAVQLVRKGKAYVCDMTPEETDEYRRLGKESPFRNRSTEENLDLLARMKAAEFPDGARTLRANRMGRRRRVLA